MYSAPYLTLTAGDKGIKCPSVSPKQCRKVPSGTPPLAMMAVLSASHATAHRWLHSLPPRAPGEAPRATRWWMRWSVGTEWPPATASALPLLLSCRVRKLAAHRASRYLVWSSRQAPLAGALLPCRSAWRVAASSLECLGWPSRQAPLAGALPFATVAILSASHATAHCWLHSLPPRAPGEALRATHWWMCWSVGTEWPPAAASALPLLLSCRVRKVVAHRASRYLGWSSRQAPLAGALLPCRSARRVAASSLVRLGWPSRQAPLAGALSPCLEYFVLEWLQRNHGGPWRSPGKPCRGVLQLPVHTSGILGYPYSSTPTALPERAARRGKFLGAPWLAFPASSSCRGLVSLS